MAHYRVWKDTGNGNNLWNVTTSIGACDSPVIPCIDEADARQLCAKMNAAYEKRYTK